MLRREGKTTLLIPATWDEEDEKTLEDLEEVNRLNWYRMIEFISD